MCIGPNDIFKEDNLVAPDLRPPGAYAMLDSALVGRAMDDPEEIRKMHRHAATTAKQLHDEMMGYLAEAEEHEKSGDLAAKQLKELRAAISKDGVDAWTKCLCEIEFVMDCAGVEYERV